jgi:cyclopropane-fatty-acyl-phospholipid synthase
MRLTTTPSELAHADPRPATFGERLFSAALSAMENGRLTVMLEDGRTLEFGSGPESGPVAFVRVRRQGFFRRCLLFGDIGFAEGYLAGEWDTDDLVAVFRWFLANVESSPGLSGTRRGRAGLNVLAIVNRLRHLLRRNSVGRSPRNIREHYDLSNRFFAEFLDPGMTYSSAYWPSDDLTLEQAQEAKYDRLCRQMRLGPGDSVLEIGCGWGGFALHAASRYGCRVTGLTLSLEQAALARERVASAGLGDRIEIRIEDYRHVEGRFTRIASIEMLEAVGHRYQPDFANACARLLGPDGLIGLQYITCPDSRYDKLRRNVDFIQKHIFPGSLLLSAERLGRLFGAAGNFALHDLHDLGACYARTLREWRSRFELRLDAVRGLGFDETFIRKWRYYLAYCEAGFDTRNISVVQALYSRPNNRALHGVAIPVGDFA